MALVETVHVIATNNGTINFQKIHDLTQAIEVMCNLYRAMSASISGIPAVTKEQHAQRLHTSVGWRDDNR